MTPFLDSLFGLRRQILNLVPEGMTVTLEFDRKTALRVCYLISKEFESMLLDDTPKTRILALGEVFQYRGMHVRIVERAA